MVELEVGKPDGFLCIYVRDSGRGMEPRPDSPGAGFGLSIIAESRRSTRSVPAPTAGPSSDALRPRVGRLRACSAPPCAPATAMPAGAGRVRRHGRGHGDVAAPRRARRSRHGAAHAARLAGVRTAPSSGPAPTTLPLGIAGPGLRRLARVPRHPPRRRRPARPDVGETRSRRPSRTRSRAAAATSSASTTLRLSGAPRSSGADGLSRGGGWRGTVRQGRRTGSSGEPVRHRGGNAPRRLPPRSSKVSRVRRSPVHGDIRSRTASGVADRRPGTRAARMPIA